VLTVRNAVYEFVGPDLSPKTPADEARVLTVGHRGGKLHAY